MERNLFLDLHAFETQNTNALVNMIRFIQDTNKGADINETYYLGSVGTMRSSVKTDNTYYSMISFSPFNMATKLLSHISTLSLEDLTFLFHHTKIDLTSEKNNTSYLAKPEAPLSQEEIKQISRKILTLKTVEGWAEKLSFKEQTPSWTASQIFSPSLVGADNTEKIKFLVLELKKQFAQKPVEFEKFKQNLFIEKSAFFTSAFSHQNFALLDFLMEELDFDINQPFDGAPLFFKADCDTKIAYVVENGADIKNAKDDKNQTYADFWTPKPNGKTVLTLLSAKSAEAVDMGELYLNLLKNQKTVAEIKDVLNKVARKEKIKNKSLVKVANQSPMYQALKHQHWKFAKSIYDSLAAADPDFKKNLYNETDVKTKTTIPLLFILANKDTSYDTNDKRGERRKFFLKEALLHTDFQELSKSNDFMRLFTNYIAKAPLAFMDSKDIDSQTHAALRGLGLTRNEEFLTKIKSDRRYATQSGGYRSSNVLNYVEVRSEFLSYFIDSINLPAKDVVSIIARNFISPRGEKVFTNTDSSLLFFLEIADRTLQPEDKKQLVKKYIESVEVLLENRRQEVEKARISNPNYKMPERYSNYNFEALPVQKLLEGLTNYNGYSFDEKDVAVVRKLFAVLPIDDTKKSEKPEIEEAIMAKLEKQLVENQLRNVLAPKANTENGSAKRLNKI